MRVLWLSQAKLGDGDFNIMESGSERGMLMKRG